MNNIFSPIYHLLQYAIATAILFVVLLMVVRLILIYADPNPFGWFGKMAYSVRRFSEPLVGPVKAWLSFRGFSVNLAPIITLLLIILAGYFLLMLCWEFVFTLNGVVGNLRLGLIVSLIGVLLYGVLAIYSLMIFARIILSWFGIYGSRFYRLLARATDPVLTPFRQLLPPVGMFDVSPMILLFLLSLFKNAIIFTLVPNAGMFAP